MILRCSYEELKALESGARAILTAGPGDSRPVAAPPESRAAMEAFLSRLTGDLTVETLAQQRRYLQLVDTIVARLLAEMNACVLAEHAAAEHAVAAYFGYAHALTVRRRLAEMGREMAALIELVTGTPPDPGVAETFLFPD
ncbi:MAG: hypothetical protein HY704_14780 [Gemmatimonadetes bacterium]|nr:hypothetical protein [Gemmatimonadota bacterium]